MSKGQELTGVAPIKNKYGFILRDDNVRGNSLNDQFASAFTRKNITKGHIDIPCMPNSIVDWKGVHMLLINMKIIKAPGQYEITPFFLKAAATELAPLSQNYTSFH